MSIAEASTPSTRFEGGDDVDATLSAIALAGALAQLSLGWIEGRLAISRERLVRHAAGLIVAAAAIHSHNDGNTATDRPPHTG